MCVRTHTHVCVFFSYPNFLQFSIVISKNVLMENENLIFQIYFLLKDSAIINEDNLPMFHRCGIMALVAAYLNFVSQMIAVPAFCQHVSKVRDLEKFLT